MIVVPIKTEVFKRDGSLEQFINKHLPIIKEGSVLVVTSKIVALSQGRVVSTDAKHTKDYWIKKESEQFLKTKWCYLTLKDGHWCPNAGIDESNAKGKLILWPVNPYRVAERLRKVLRKKHNLKKIGVLITDSRIFPLRAGVTGVALGYAGFQGLRNYIGLPDIFGRKLKMTTTNIADGLATSAVLAMGEGNEQMPLALIEDVPAKFTEKNTPTELRIDPKDDLYSPLFRDMDSQSLDLAELGVPIDSLPEVTTMKQGSFAAKLFKRVAARAGVKVHVEPYGYAGQITFRDGTNRYFRTTNFDLNTLGASETARDKDFANYFMRRMGYPVIEGKAFYSPRWSRKLKSNRNPQAAYRYAVRLGFPVIVKPNSLSQGQGVAKVFNRRDFMRAVSVICKQDRVFLVQRVVTGRDYRIVVLDGKIISAYERLALMVTGDGRSAIRTLLARKQRMFKRTGRDTVINVDDRRITGCLRRLGMTRSSVPAKGQEVQLLDNRNLSSGGEPVDVTTILHPSFRKLAIQLVKDMGLRFCGVDLMVQGDISAPVGDYYVIEINSAPGIDNYASAGKKQQKIVEQMYVQVLKAMH